jgi:hypothetical protein
VDSTDPDPYALITAGVHSGERTTS